MGCNKPAADEDGPTAEVEVSQAEASSDAGFREIALESGLDFHMSFLPGEQGENFKVNLYDHGCGLAVGDYDGDGNDDIYFTNQLGPNALFRNTGSGTFEEVTKRSGPIDLDDRICVGATFNDYDNDGDQDLYVTSTRGGNVLFQNNGTGKFADVTEKAGLVCVAHSQTAAFFDYDSDGYLDLFLTNTAKWTLDQFDEQANYYLGAPDFEALFTSPIEYNILYHNNRDGTFTDVTEEAGVKGRGWGGDTAVFDYDDDGHMDLIVSNMFGITQLYRNEGNGKFRDVTSDTFKLTSFGAVGMKLLDIDNDGNLDLCIADMHSDMWTKWESLPTHEISKTKYRYMGGPYVGIIPGAREKEEELADLMQIKYDELLFGNSMFLNRGEGNFEEISDQAGFETFWPWGVATGDFNCDGFEDIFLPSGMGYPFGYWQSYLMMNQGNNTFKDEAASAGIEPLPRGMYLEERIAGTPSACSMRCAATADFDGDGRLDIITNNFNDAPYYFQNRFPKQNYVSFRLQGTKSNRDAIGAIVRLRIGDGQLVRQVQSAGGYLSQSTKTLHFGLGEGNKIDEAVITWPSGIKQSILNPQINTQHEITEPAGNDD